MRRALSYWWLSLVVSLGWLVVPAFFDPMDHHPLQRATMDLRALQTALDLFRLDRGRYPTPDEGLEALMGTYIKRLPHDPWGSSYAYGVGSTGIGSVYSVGQNRADEDGAGDDLTRERDRRICDEYDKHCVRHLSAYPLLAVALSSLAVGIVRVVLSSRRAALRLVARLRGH